MSRAEEIMLRELWESFFGNTPAGLIEVVGQTSVVDIIGIARLNGSEVTALRVRGENPFSIEQIKEDRWFSMAETKEELARLHLPVIYETFNFKEAEKWVKDWK